VGDPFQLPPIGPGLVFHVLAESDAVPQQELTQVHRQAAGSRIPGLANDIRLGRVPSFDSFTGPAPGVAFIDASSRHITRAVIDVTQSLARSGEVQILGARKHGEAGVETLNAAFHRLVADGRVTVSKWGFAEGEPVIHLVNDYDRDLFNGSLGCIRRITSERSPAGTLNHAIECDFDGVIHRFAEGSLDRIELAHAITVHKAQGSQFQRVVIPVLPSRLLDRTLVYTALTRAIDQVVLIGDRAALAAAIIAPPRSQQRRVGFWL
jgi:exodeoxyribonuclease V alpha subunit